MQAKAWTETRTATLWAQPAFSDVWYNLMVDGAGETAVFTKMDTPAATDGKMIMLDPERYFKYALDERVFINCHEILHAVLDHPRQFMSWKRAGKIKFADGSSLPFDEETAQNAGDMVVNAILVDAKVGKTPADARFDLQRVPPDMSLVDAYRVVYKQKPPKGGGKGDDKDEGKPKPPPGALDTHMEPGTSEGKTPDEAMGEHNEGEWQTAVAAAMESAKLQGKLPAGLERLLKKVLQPEVDWQDKLRTTLARRIGNSGASWSELDEHLIHRGIGAPGRISFGAGTIVVALDTSGSMTQEMMDKIMAETGGILDDIKPRRMIFIQCDAEVHEAVEIDDSVELQRRKMKGGGGTDFRPVFDWLDKEGVTPDSFIYFTDTYGCFPDRAPNYPVIWASLVKQASVPWGDYIDVPIKQGA